MAYTWTDDPLQEQATKVKHVHINELYERLRLEQSHFGLTQKNYTDKNTGDKVFSLDYKSIRDDINDIYASCTTITNTTTWNTDWGDSSNPNKLQGQKIDTTGVGSTSNAAIQLEELRHKLNELNDSCPCDCNYCNCNYCNCNYCNCNYCTCDCNYCDTDSSK